MSSILDMAVMVICVGDTYRLRSTERDGMNITVERCWGVDGRVLSQKSFKTQMPVTVDEVLRWQAYAQDFLQTQACSLEFLGIYKNAHELDHELTKRILLDAEEDPSYRFTPLNDQSCQRDARFEVVRAKA